MNVPKNLIGLPVAIPGKAPDERLLDDWFTLYRKSVDADESQAIALHVTESDDFVSMYPLYLEGELFAPVKSQALRETLQGTVTLPRGNEPGSLVTPVANWEERACPANCHPFVSEGRG